MASPGHTFPGGLQDPFNENAHNPFAPKRSPSPLPASATHPIQNVIEEEENDTLSSPTNPNFRKISQFDQLGVATDGAGDLRGHTGPLGPPSAFKPPTADGGFPGGYGMGRRTSVSAESLNPTDSSSDKWTPPYHAKSAEQLRRLKEAVGQHTLFRGLGEEQMDVVIGALVEKGVPVKNIKVITQGDQGDFFYIVERGSFSVYIKSEKDLADKMSLGTHVATISVGGTFGELALMYGAPRNATVVSQEDNCCLWALDRVTFRRILMDGAFRKRRMYEGFLKEVPLLEGLQDYERNKVADALESVTYPAGHTIISEGDVGDSFYLLESGEAAAYKKGVERAVRHYKKGDFFGELALLNDKPRAASVVCESECKVARLGREGFSRLLGPVESIMRRTKYGEEEVDPLSKA